METINQELTTPLKKSNYINEPLITVSKSQLWAKLIDPFLYGMIEKNFYSVQIINKQNFYSGNPDYAKLLFGVHSCFHDGQIAYYLCKKFFNSNFHIMVEDLYKLPQLSKVGAFSIEKNSPFQSLKSLNYASNLLKDKNNMLWIFPQGRVMPPDYKPIKFESGLSYICNKAKKLNIIPVAIKYTFVRQHKPEIFAEFGEPVVIDNGVSNKTDFTEFLETQLENLVEKQNVRISNGEFDKYECIYKNKRPLIKRIEPYLKNIVFDKRHIKIIN